MRDIKAINVGNVWQIVNTITGSIFFQALEGVLSFTVTSSLSTPANNVTGSSLPVLNYHTATGYVWVRAVEEGRLLSGIFSTAGERILFEGLYAALQQSVVQQASPVDLSLVTSLGSVTENDTTHPVAASALFDLAAALTAYEESVADNYVFFGGAQTLTNAQKVQALANIGAKKAYNMLPTKTDAYAPTLADFKDAVDLYDKVYLRMNLAAIGDVTISSALTSLPNLSEISIRDLGAARATLVEDGTTLNGLKTFTVQNEVKTLVKVGTNEWDIIGALV